VEADGEASHLQNVSKKKTKKRKRLGECWEEQVKGKKKFWGRDRLPI
jgi:hypothetical protein